MSGSGSLSFRTCVLPVAVVGTIMVLAASTRWLQANNGANGGSDSRLRVAAVSATIRGGGGDAACPSLTPLLALAPPKPSLPPPYAPPASWFVPVAPDYKSVTFAQLYVDRTNKLVHCNINKNGCTNWKRILYRLVHPNMPSKDIPGPTQIHRAEVHGLTMLASLPRAEAEAIINDPTYSFFVTVRDPIERFASAYLDKCYRAADWAEQQWCGVPVRQGDTTTVDAVIGHVAGEDMHKIDPHFRPQYLMCGLRTLRHKFTVFHFDTVVEEAKAWGAANPNFSPMLRRRWDAALDEMFTNAERQYVPPHLTARKEDVLTPARVRRLTQLYYGDLLFFQKELAPHTHDLPYPPIDPAAILPSLH